MTEVDARFEQAFHGDYGHSEAFLSVVPPPGSTPGCDHRFSMAPRAEVRGRA
jgi:hypothetical protein